MSATIVDRKEMTAAMRIMGKITPKKCRIPILSNVKIQANGKLELSATDLECSARITLPVSASSAGEWSALLNQDSLSRIVKASKGEVTLSPLDDVSVQVDGGKLSRTAPEDFPVYPVIDKEQQIAILPGSIFAEAFKRTGFCASSEVVRYALTGVLIDAGKDSQAVNFVASDGKRLAWHCATSCVVDHSARVIVPVRALERVQDIVKAFPGYDVSIYTGAEESTRTMVRFQCGPAEVTSRLIEGTFPDYVAVLPTAPKFTFDINKQALVDALKQVIPFASEKTYAVEMIFKDGMLDLRCKGADIGEGKATVQGCTIYPKACKVMLNPDYILDYLEVIPEGFDVVKASFKGDGDATRWTTTSDTGNTYVLMPLSITL